jgi:hypothetical protein
MNWKLEVRPREDRERRSGVQDVRPLLRVACAIVAAALLVAAGSAWAAGGAERWHDARGFLLFAALLGFFAVFGWRGEVDHPPATDRFLGLADPSRTLSPEDFGPPTREPIREDAVHTPPKQAPRS